MGRTARWSVRFGRARSAVVVLTSVALLAAALTGWPGAGHAAHAADDPTAGLTTIVNERGRITPSYDAEGAIGPEGTLTLRKPEGASLRRLVVFAATTGATGASLSGPVGIRVGSDPSAPLHSISEGHGTPSAIRSSNYWVDATSALKGDIDAAQAGDVDLHVTEPAPDSAVDGVAVAAVFDDPAVTADTSVTWLFGALLTGGDHFDLQLERPYASTDPAARMEMSLGISYSCQTADSCGGAGQQYSEVDVDGRRLTSAAGGEDDGVSQNGSLITIGGTGDSTADPTDPNATPTNARSDDELYDLRPFLKDGDTHISVDTRNPSGDDNVFFAGFTGNPPVADVTSSKARFVYVALGDSYQSGEGAGVDVRPQATYLKEAYENGTNYPAQVGPQDDTYLDGTDPSVATCHRALLNYAKINRDKYRPGAQVVLVDRTCSGATIAGSAGAPNGEDTTKPGVVGPVPADDPRGVNRRSQVAQAIQRLGIVGLTADDVDLVTVGMGGNDAGFADLVQSCVTGSIVQQIVAAAQYTTSVARALAVSQAQWLASCQNIDAVSSKTDSKIAVLRARETDADTRILAAFPRARVLQLDYPNILPTGVSPAYCGGISRNDIHFARTETGKIDDGVKKGIMDARDPRLSLVSVDDAFGPNALCPSTAADQLANGITQYALDAAVATALVPDTDGGRALAVLISSIDRLRACLVNQANFLDGSSCNVSQAKAAVQAAASSLVTAVTHTFKGRLVSPLGQTDDSPEVALDRSQGLFHPNPTGIAVLACAVRAAYASTTPEGCASSTPPPLSTVNGQFVGAPPVRVAQESQVALSLAGFGPSTPVTLTLHSEPQPLGTFTADNTGTVHATVALPLLSGGVHTIDAAGATATGVAYTVQVRLQLPGRANGSYGLYLTGFTPDPAAITVSTPLELVDVYLDDQLLGRYTPDEAGGLLLDVPVPGRWGSTAPFVVRAVSELTGTTVTQTIENPVPSAPGLWALGAEPDAVRVSGDGTTVTGRVHSEGGIVVKGADIALTGGVEYATSVAASGAGLRLQPAPIRVAAGQGAPEAPTLADYRPGGPEARAAARYTAVAPSQCVNGVWTPASSVVLTGVVYVPCAVTLTGTRRTVDATVAAEGPITVAGSALTVGPSASGPALVSGAGGEAITITGASTSIRGTVFATSGRVRVTGAGDSLTCGVQAKDIDVSGARLSVPMTSRCLA